MKSHKHLQLSKLLILLSAVLATVLTCAPAYASQPNNKSSSSGTTPAQSNTSPILQSFSADASVYPGMLVSLNPKQQGSVVPLKLTTINNMTGAVVPINGAQIALTPQNFTKQQVLVASSGRYNVLVSNQAGSISSGDYLTMSSVAGIAMKASESDKTVIGQAEGSFNGKSDVISSVNVKNSAGKTSAYSIGSIQANLQLEPNPIFAKSTSGIPSFVVRAAYTLANKPVNPGQIYLSFLVVLAVIIVTSSMFYSGTRSGIISIGRNPLSQKSIAKGLAQTIVAGLAVFCVGVAIVYAILMF